MSIATLEKERVNRSDKRIRTTAFITVFVLAICSGILSYASLYDLAVQAGIHQILATLFPIVIDGLILSGTLLILYFANRGTRSYYGLLLTGIGVVASIAGNVSVSDNTLTAQLVHAAPPLVLFFALEALSILMRARSKQRIEEEAREAAEIASETPDVEPDPALDIPAPISLRADFESLEEKTNLTDRSFESPVHEGKNPSNEIEHAPVIEKLEIPSLEAPVFGAPAPAPAPALAPAPAVEDRKPVVVTNPVLQQPTELPQYPVTREQTVQSHSNEDQSNDNIVTGGEFDELPTTRAKANWLLDRYPAENPLTLADLIPGDRKYNRKLFKEELSKREN